MKAVCSCKIADCCVGSCRPGWSLSSGSGTELFTSEPIALKK